MVDVVDRVSDLADDGDQLVAEFVDGVLKLGKIAGDGHFVRETHPVVVLGIELDDLHRLSERTLNHIEGLVEAVDDALEVPFIAGGIGTL